MRKKFCPKCGIETEEFISSVCRDCFLKKFSILKELPDKIAIKNCSSCGKFYIDNQSAFTTEKTLELFLGKLLKFKEVIDASYRIHAGKLHLTVEIHSGGADKTEVKEIVLVEKKIICKSCGMKFSGYFNSIIQLRCPEEKSDRIKEEIQKAKNIILIECNVTGQLGRLIREKTGIKIENRLLKYDGRPWQSDELNKYLKEML